MFWMIALSLCILAIYVGLLIIGHMQSRKFAHWNSTTGKILSCSMKIHKNVPGERRYDKEDTELIEFPHVEYEYRVGETTFRSSQISQITDPTQLAAERTLTRYPLGSTAKVYFDPADPKIAALERGHSSADYLEMAVKKGASAAAKKGTSERVG